MDVVGARREEQFQRREQIIKKKDLELQENLIRFNKFLQVPPPAVPLDCYSGGSSEHRRRRKMIPSERGRRKSSSRRRKRRRSTH